MFLRGIGTGMNLPLDALTDLIEVGAIYFKRGWRKFEDWSTQMIDSVGEWGRERLPILWKKVAKEGEQSETRRRRDTVETELQQTTGAGDTSARVSDSGTTGRVSNVRRPPIRVADEGVLPRPRDYVRPDSYGGKLDGHQQLGINLALTAFLSNKFRGFLLGDGTGMGKTRQILVIANEYAKAQRRDAAAGS